MSRCRMPAVGGPSSARDGNGALIESSASASIFAFFILCPPGAYVSFTAKLSCRLGCLSIRGRGESAKGKRAEKGGWIRTALGQSSRGSAIDQLRLCVGCFDRRVELNSIATLLAGTVA